MESIFRAILGPRKEQLKIAKEHELAGLDIRNSARFNQHDRLLKLLRKYKGTQAVNWKDIDGRIALHWAALNGNTDVLLLLILSGASLNAKSVHGDTPLHCAAIRGRTDCLKILLNEGALRSQPDEDGDTALHVASSRGHIECVKLLIQCGAVINTKNFAGQTPYDVVHERIRDEFLSACAEIAGGFDKENRPQIEQSTATVSMKLSKSISDGEWCALRPCVCTCIQSK